MFRGLCSEGADPIKLLEERESLMTIFPQIFAHTLKKDIACYSLDPKTRYRGLNMLKPRLDVTQLYDSDTHPTTESMPMVGRVGKQ